MKILQKIMTKMPPCYQPPSIGSAHPTDALSARAPRGVAVLVHYVDLHMGLVQPCGARYTTGKRGDYSVYIRIWKYAEILVWQQFGGAFIWPLCRTFAGATMSARVQ